jgi:apolipoprotein D and lipocalin family protein
MALLHRLAVPPLPWLAAIALALAGSLPATALGDPAPASSGDPAPGLPSLAPAQAAPAAPATAMPARVQPLPIPVASVDLNRYAGIWHEIARIPNRFQQQCARDTLTRYTLRADGRIDVVNQCIKRNGSVDQARGIAKVVDAETGAKLKVSLMSLLGWRPFWGDYWIVGLDPNYRWAVVGAPNRKYGWILARSKTLDANSLETISAIIERNGYQRGSFQMDGQGP